ncbi:MAG: LysM peptidoglycan-binding domain-containing protein [bacterium]
MKRLASLLVLPLLVLAACKGPQKGIEAEDSSNPYFRQAAQYVAEQNYNAAIKEYETALQANPVAARAHLEIALLYNDKLNDPIGAIYHFQRYLQARPNAIDRDQVQIYIDKAKIDLVVKQPNSPLQNAEETANLGKENIDLKYQLAQLQAKLGQKEGNTSASLSFATPTVQPVPTTPAGETNAGTTPPAHAEEVVKAALPVTPADVAAQKQEETIKTAEQKVLATTHVATNATSPAPAGEARQHVIQKGDSLWKIATQYYPDDVVQGIGKIKDANPEATQNEKNLKLGQTLVIP